MVGFYYTLDSSFVTDRLISKRIAVLSINQLRMKNCVQRFVSYRAVNTPRVGYENKSVNFVNRNIHPLLREIENI
jgi:hypothetical protein